MVMDREIGNKIFMIIRSYRNMLRTGDLFYYERSL
nr:MAG TPA: hypothetical protein [Caudoviricetes sp.]DAW17728.1 MAG TPA: hypothetical protein [Caudoviricetes sp.]